MKISIIVMCVKLYQLKLSIKMYTLCSCIYCSHATFSVTKCSFLFVHFMLLHELEIYYAYEIEVEKLKDALADLKMSRPQNVGHEGLSL